MEPTVIGKVGLHKRVYRARGKAAEYACVTCGGQARDWSQTHGTTGLDVYDYEPRCRSCHTTYDGKAAYMRGIRALGERHGHAKLTAADIPVIRQRLSSGEGCKRIAKDFPVSWEAIRAIARGKTWREVPH